MSAPPPAPAIASPARGSETILLVEDQAEVRLLAREILTRHGYRVFDAANGEDALALCHSCPDVISLLVTDVIMPGYSGPELARLFAAIRPGIPVLFMSGYDAGAVDADAAHIAKPFAPSAFVAKVRELLDLAGTPPTESR